MSGSYTVPFDYTGNANVDLLEVVAASNKVLVILGVYVGQTSDVGDAAEEILNLSIKSGQTTSGSGGSASTPVPNDSGGAAAAFTAEQANTTKASAGTILTHRKMAWNIRQDFDKLFSESEQILIAGSRRATLEVSAAADSLTMSGHLLVQEIG